jgi:hypothetical protein
VTSDEFPSLAIDSVADSEAIEHFNVHGWLLTEPLDMAQVALLQSWIDEIERWGDNGEWLHYRESTVHGPRLCRTENFVPFHAALGSFLTTGVLLDTASALLGEPAVLYKEKINYKAAGGGGYAPHQDAPAYRFIETHVSCMVAIDDSLISNGCLEVVSGAHQEVLDMNETGCITDELVASFEWTPVEVLAGQALWFHSRTPHRSGANTSPLSRRALYPTYNAASEGDLRERYYEQKLAEFADADDTGPRVSLIGDFQGVMIE